MNARKMFMGLLVGCGLMINSADAQVYVKIRPPRPQITITKTSRPGPAHVWIDNDWRYRNGRYEYRGGYWAAPPRAGWHYREGHWRHGRRGWVWVPGRWVNRGGRGWR